MSDVSADSAGGVVDDTTSCTTILQMLYEDEARLSREYEASDFDDDEIGRKLVSMRTLIRDAEERVAALFERGRREMHDRVASGGE